MEPTKRCPYCGELILRIAIRCKHCQADLRGTDGAEQTSGPAGVGPAGPLPVLPGTDPSVGTSAPAAFPPAEGPSPLPPLPTSPSGPLPPPSGAPLVVSAPRPQAAGDGELHENRLGYVPPAEGTFEQRFLDFAFRTNLPIYAATVAYALKMPIDEADEGLQDLAARDVLVREVDPRGTVTYILPGRSAVAAATSPAASTTALSPYAQPPPLLYDPPGSLSTAPTENTALAGLLVNVCFPGLGSLIGGKTSAGVFQLLMFLLGLPLCIVVIGAPMVIGAWIWGLVTGVNMLNEAKQAQQRPTLAG